MGMFDSFLPKGDTRFACSEGHVFVELQTKEFDCLLDYIEIVDGKLMRHDGLGRKPRRLARSRRSA